MNLVRQNVALADMVLQVNDNIMEPNRIIYIVKKNNCFSCLATRMQLKRHYKDDKRFVIKFVYYDELPTIIQETVEPRSFPIIIFVENSNVLYYMYGSKTLRELEIFMRNLKFID